MHVEKSIAGPRPFDAFIRGVGQKLLIKSDRFIYNMERIGVDVHK